MIILIIIDINLKMGITDSRSILSKIESQYKSLRKYCDPFYGQITVIQHKSSKRLYALIQKTFLKANSQLQQFLESTHMQDNYLLKPENYEVCDLSLCSDVRLYFFLFEYVPHSLEREIQGRMEENRSFKVQEAVGLFVQQIQIIQVMKARINPESGKMYRFMVGNGQFLCSPLLQLKALEPVFKNDPEGFQHMDKMYHSPEAVKLIQHGEHFRVREVLNRQSSLVFTLALNFMELLLLADLSVLYDQNGEFINEGKLDVALQEIEVQYGQEMEGMLRRMLHHQEGKRPSLNELKRWLKSKKNGRRSISRFQKQKSFSTQIC